MKTILVIDDEPDLLTLARMGLELMPGWRIHTACQPLEGLRLARELCPDAIVLDLSFPDLDGRELLVELKNQPATRSIPVLLATATALPCPPEAAGVLVKPFDVTSLGPFLARRLGWETNG